MKTYAAVLPFISDYSLLAVIAVASVVLAVWFLIKDTRRK